MILKTLHIPLIHSQMITAKNKIGCIYVYKRFAAAILFYVQNAHNLRTCVSICIAAYMINDFMVIYGSTSRWCICGCSALSQWLFCQLQKVCQVRVTVIVIDDRGSNWGAIGITVNLSIRNTFYSTKLASCGGIALH